MNRGGKFIFGKSIIHENGTIQILIQAIFFRAFDEDWNMGKLEGTESLLDIERQAFIVYL